MIIKDQDSAIRVLRAVTNRLEPKLLPNDAESVWELIEVGEWSLAYDTLCTQLDEYDTKIDLHSYEDLAYLGEYYGVESSMWEVLRPL